MTLIEKLRLMQVKRFGIMHVNREQSVAEHSFNVTVIALELVRGEIDIPVADVLIYALSHDIDEIFTGDIPSTFKRQLRAECPAVVKLLDGVDFVPKEVKAIVKLADWLEVIHYVREFGGSRLTKQQVPEMVDNFYQFANTCGVRDSIRLKALKIEKML